MTAEIEEFAGFMDHDYESHRRVGREMMSRDEFGDRDREEGPDYFNKGGKAIPISVLTYSATLSHISYSRVGGIV